MSVGPYYRYRIEKVTSTDVRMPNISQSLPHKMASLSPYVLSGHVEEVLLFNNFFLIVDTRLSCEEYNPTNLCDGAQMANFWRFFASCIFNELRAARFRPAS